MTIVNFYRYIASISMDELEYKHKLKNRLFNSEVIFYVNKSILSTTRIKLLYAKLKTLKDMKTSNSSITLREELFHKNLFLRLKRVCVRQWKEELLLDTKW
jgi:hypothetical protein